MSAFFTTGAAELERQTLAALRAFHLRGTTAPSPGAPPPIAPPPVGPTPASPPEVEPHDPFYWRNVVASLEQTAGPKLDATTKLAARLEAQHKLTPLTAIVMRLCDEKHANDYVRDALYALRAEWRKKSCGPHYWANVVFAALAGARGFALTADRRIPDDTPPEFKNTTWLAAAPHLAFIADAFSPYFADASAPKILEVEALAAKLRLARRTAGAGCT